MRPPKPSNTHRSPHVGRDFNLSTLTAGFVAMLTGYSSSVVLMALPEALVISIAALALLGSIAAGLAKAMESPGEREAALIAFIVTASGFTLFSIGSAFWGLIAGAATLLLLPSKPRQSSPEPTHPAELTEPSVGEQKLP